MSSQAAVHIEKAPVKAISVSRLKLWRRLSQLAFLGILGQWALYGLVRCPFLVPFVSCQNCPVITCWGRIPSLFWGFWISLPISALLAGRVFCGFACPGGLANELLAKLAPFGRGASKWWRVLGLGKFAGLAAALVILYWWGQPRTNVPIRVGGDFIGAAALTFEHAFPSWLWRTGLTMAALACGLVVASAFCRFVCPTGGALELFRPLARFGFWRTASCKACPACRKACPRGTMPGEADCTNCGDCQAACPSGSIVFGKRG